MPPFPLKRVNYIAPMLATALILVVLLSGSLEFPSLSSPVAGAGVAVSASRVSRSERKGEGFVDLLGAYELWDSAVGCTRFRAKHSAWAPNASAIQAASSDGGTRCGDFRLRHVNVLVKGWTWIPDNLEGMYPCACGVSCVWSKAAAAVDRPDAELFENAMPPAKRRHGDPLRVYLDLEASRKPTGLEDIFIGYHVSDDIQVTYAGKSFHISRSYHLSTLKQSDALVYWSSSRCLPHRDELAESFLSKVSHHSFGKCLNNVGGPDKAVLMYPECRDRAKTVPYWADHLHCAMSHYKFVLAIENTVTESYVTEKLFYALEAGAVPIYFGAPNVWDFVPPHSIIDGSKFSSIDQLVSHVKAIADDPVAYAEYHAWRRCGVWGGFGRTREASLDTLPCRLCEFVSRKGGREA